jgi:hypothetical protein
MRCHISEEIGIRESVEGRREEPLEHKITRNKTLAAALSFC